MLEKVDCLRFVRVKLNFLDDYADIQRGERLFSERRVLRGMINEGRKIAGVKPLTFKVYGKRRKNERKSREN